MKIFMVYNNYSVKIFCFLCPHIDLQFVDHRQLRTLSKSYNLQLQWGEKCEIYGKKYFCHNVLPQSAGRIACSV